MMFSCPTTSLAARQQSSTLTADAHFHPMVLREFTQNLRPRGCHAGRKKKRQHAAQPKK